MFGLSRCTHRYFVEPVSGKVHVKNMLLKRFLSFLNQIEKSKKKLPKRILRYVMKDTRSATGSNLRKMMLLFGKVKVEDITESDVDAFKYAAVPPGDEWRVEILKEIIAIRNSNLEVENFDEEELDEIMNYLCTS